MRIRTSFISNSSSSSFIICGTRLNKDELKFIFPKMEKDEDWDFYDYEGQGKYPNVIYNDDSKDKNYFVGKLIASFTDEEPLEDGEIDKTIYNDPKVKYIKRKCKHLPDFKIRIYYGTRSD